MRNINCTLRVTPFWGDGSKLTLEELQKALDARLELSAFKITAIDWLSESITALAAERLPFADLVAMKDYADRKVQEYRLHPGGEIARNNWSKRRFDIGVLIESRFEGAK